MFGLFSSQPFTDPILGACVRSRSMWRGSVSVDARSGVPLVLAGDRSQPDPDALLMARAVPQIASSQRSAIEAALFEHYEPYAENDDLPLADDQAPITSSADIWPHVRLEFVAVTRHGGKLTAELGYRVAWDEEHMLGARLRDGVLVELCGSVLAP